MKSKQHSVPGAEVLVAEAAICPSAKPVGGRKKAGRPLSFDRDAALEKAMFTFWKYGYETTSLNDLTTAMGITPPSLYGAFGDKEKLFMEAVLRYTRLHYGAVEDIMRTAPTAREGMQKLLEKAAIEHTCPDHPPGCMVMTSVTNCTEASVHLQKEVAEIGERNREVLISRIQRGINEGELPPGSCAANIAGFYVTILQGMTHQARSNASCQDLQNIVKMAMKAWPA